MPLIFPASKDVSRPLGGTKTHTSELRRHEPGSYSIASFALLRFATLPYAILGSLRPARCLEALDRADIANAQMAAEADPLADDLFELVSQIEACDKSYRRDVLRLKRDIHNGKPTALGDSLLDRVSRDLSDAGAARVLRWNDAQCALRKAHADADTALTDELQSTVRTRLREMLHAPTFHHALALAAPGLVTHAARERRLPEKAMPDNFERSLLGYAIRAVAKTSPFSSFMSTTAIDISRGMPETLALHGLLHQCRTRLNRGVIARIDAAAAAAAVDEVRSLRTNPTLVRIGPQRFRALCDRFVVTIGRPWRQQARTNFHLNDMLSNVLLAHADEAPPAVWCERLIAAGVDPSRATGLVPQLAARGMLLYAGVSDAFDDAPERALRDSLTAVHGLDDVAKAVDSMIDVCARMTDGADASARAAGAEHIRELEAQALTRLGVQKFESLQNVVLEDCWSTGLAEGSPDNAHNGAMQDLAEFLSTQVGWSPHYCLLRERFVGQFGEGGCCDDVLDFMSESGSQLVEPVEKGNTAKAKPILSAPPGVHLPVTVQAQPIAAQDPMAARLVVNKVYENMGWLTARFGVGDTPEHVRLRSGLRQWIHDVAGDREPVDLLVGGECNDLQAHPRLTDRVLRMSSEPLLQGEAIEIEHLRLSHDRASNLLVLSERGVRELHVCYLGGTMVNPSWGVPYALALLGQPYVLMRPAYQPPELASGSEIEFAPRMFAGQVVLRRAMWWVSTDYLRRAWFGGLSGAQRLAAVRAECRHTGLPEMFFVRRPVQGVNESVSNNVLNANRKPLWVDIGNPFCLTLLERMCEGVQWISFTEVLPDADAQWLSIDDKMHVCELQFELLLRCKVE